MLPFRIIPLDFLSLYSQLLSILRTWEMHIISKVHATMTMAGEQKEHSNRVPQFDFQKSIWTSCLEHKAMVAYRPGRLLIMFAMQFSENLRYSRGWEKVFQVAEAVGTILLREIVSPAAVLHFAADRNVSQTNLPKTPHNIYIISPCSLNNKAFKYSPSSWYL